MKEMTKREAEEERRKKSSFALLFHASWCGNCKVMEKALKEAAPPLPVLMIDTEAQSEYAEELGVETLPTLIIFKEGEEYIRVRGARTRSEIERLLKL